MAESPRAALVALTLTVALGCSCGPYVPSAWSTHSSMRVAHPTRVYERTTASVRTVTRTVRGYVALGATFLLTLGSDSAPTRRVSGDRLTGR